MKSRIRPEKIRHALAYIASKLPEHGNMYKVLKVMYFADKEHLHRYGRMIFGDRYIAIQHGPVPSHAYNSVKQTKSADFIASMGLNVVKNHIFEVNEGNTIVALVNPEMGLFSQSDLECIDHAIELCRPLSFGKLKKLSHDQAYLSADENDEMSLESIASLAPESKDTLLNYLRDPYPG